ncbi:MAG: hypothetical protein OEX04_08075 [Acidimicrobiia bacterium]|nr:hypothetical protein [Acidimicrobiia bacterium]
MMIATGEVGLEVIMFEGPHGRLALFGVALSMLGCGGDPSAPFTLQVSPEFVQGVIPGSESGVLVSIVDTSDTQRPVTVSATAAGAEVSVEPSEIREGEVAEIVVVAESTAIERPLDIVVTARRGTYEVREVKPTVVLPWEDDRGEYAAELLGIFADWLIEHEPGIAVGSPSSGSMVAPSLLVVSHYMFRSEAWEIGLSWHVMIPPDDWAEIYLRPHDELAPTLAFRLASQAWALERGEVIIEEVPAPPEVTR